MKHDPVLLEPVLEYLEPSRNDGTIVDATVGLGGHTEALLERHPDVRLIGIDRDPEALERSRERLSRFGDRVTLVRGRHESLIDILKQSGTPQISGLLADLGVSSMQLDDASRGFSFRSDAPLDMRMGSDGRTAADLVNAMDERELANVLRDFGEEPMARRIARAIVEARGTAPIETTARLAEVIRSVKRARPHEIDPSTLTFQALRIATNEELVGLDRFVDDAVSALESKARVAIISFHSLEDRIVKRAFRRLEGECTCPPNMPVCGCGAKAIVKTLTRHPVTASEEEIQRNPRSRSAKLRVAEKL
ncbi:MAG: 16S rRNA (cytosine(1402)-N(4))-methyltransferase RsmH [Acidobacteria bacterium]|nr:16S rRNA (cytosine(1402)-N(4))-methyltransferase RsmH [Acidobacteriota bacterium]MBV9476201.1 16S rRNA (cytosine(1402)-N(4))-methyltransferase RsmH [Acidobacteriota bacterium]